MAAYAATVTSDLKRAVKIDQVTGIGMFVGKCDITNYNSTRVEITGITGKLRSLIEVLCTAISDNGYLIRWDKTDKAFKAYYPTAADTPAGTITNGAITDGAVTVVGGQAAGSALQIEPDSDAGVLGKTVANTRTIPQATFGVAATTQGTSTFAGTAGAAAAGTEVANDVDVGVVEFVAYGLV